MKILVNTLSNIGDVILNTSVIMALRQQFHEAKITVITTRLGEGVLRGSYNIDRIIIYNKRWSLSQKIGFVFELRKESFDYVIDLKNSAIPFLVKAKKRSSLFGRSKGLLTLRDQHLQVLKKMGLSINQSGLFDFYHEEDKLSISQKIAEAGISLSGKKLIVMAPAAASEHKSWKLDKFRELLTLIVENPNLIIFLVGAEREKKINQPLTLSCPERIKNIAGMTTLRELAALLAQSALVIAHDSSILHLAYEMDRPAIGIFGPTNHNESGRVGPHFKLARAGSTCSPCNQPFCRFDRQHCYEDLTPKAVFNLVQELLHVRYD